MNDDEDNRTVWIGNLSHRITEELLYELFLQAAPLQRVKIPKDKDGKQCNYAFVTFKHEASVPYATELLNGIELFNKSLNIKPRNSNSNNNPIQNNAVRQLKCPQSFNGVNRNINLTPNMMPSRNSHMDSPRGRWENYQDRRRFNDAPYSRPIGDGYYNHNHYDRERYSNNSDRNRDFGKRKHRHR